MENQMKVCSKCKRVKSEKEFGRDSHAPDGLKYQCKECVNSSPKKPRKKVDFTCESCGTTKKVDYYSNKRRQTNFCLNCVSKETQTGIRKPRGDSSYISTDGYKMIKCDGDYDQSGRTRYRREHVIVMENHIGRRLKTQQGRNGEQVHHIDGDKCNNDIVNLLLCVDTSEHKNVDCQLHELAFELVRCGVIRFDKQEKEYKIEWDRIQ